jgi:hypothetical protein
MPLIVLIIICLCIFGPFLTIWAINTLFGLAIAYSFKTWLAALILDGLISGRRGK